MALPRLEGPSPLLSARWIYFFITALLVSWILFYLSLARTSPSVTATSSQSSLLNSLFSSYRHPLTAEKFETPTGQVFTLKEEPQFTKPLGKDVLILDVETRPLDGPGKILDRHLGDLDSMSYDTMARLSHYIYARIHGYDYKIAQPTTNEWPKTWSKVPVIRDELRNYKYVVFMDGDTVFPYPHLPIEWMMNLWGIQHNTLIAMAREIDAPRSYDSHGQLVLNTGFIIAQQSPRTEEMFEAWKGCIHDIRYPGCSNYTDRFSHEQYAFGNWVRYDFNSTDEVVTIPCSDAMGFPGRAGEGEECQGGLLGHYTLDKNMAIQAVQRSLMRYLMRDVHRDFYRDYVQLGGS